MKEFFRDSSMMIVLLIVMASPFLPILLKSKCPGCRKRKLEHLETVSKESAKGNTFITYYHCHHCKANFEREKSGPLKQVTEKHNTESELVSA
ncbi:MAG: hypothetical protein K2X27_15770 [Candidatus Obscuribacterales bacterium]|nr:hypothetical protein [Candidatus Obscuribacterales bacterium]